MLKILKGSTSPGLPGKRGKLPSWAVIIVIIIAARQWMLTPVWLDRPKVVRTFGSYCSGGESIFNLPFQESKKVGCEKGFISVRHGARYRERVSKKGIKKRRKFWKG